MLREFDISKELWREYEFGPMGNRVTYRIDHPVTLLLRRTVNEDGTVEFGTTHRVVDNDGVVHCCPGVGLQGCILRWLNEEDAPRAHF